MKRALIFLVGLALGAAIIHLALRRPDRSAGGGTTIRVPGPGREVIQGILEGNRQRYRLVDAWPTASYYIYFASKRDSIDTLVLACISRFEGLSPTMIAARNPYGIEKGGRLVSFPSWEAATDTAARVVRRLNGPGSIDLEKLGARWCPLNREAWIRNVMERQVTIDDCKMMAEAVLKIVSLQSELDAARAENERIMGLLAKAVAEEQEASIQLALANEKLARAAKNYRAVLDGMEFKHLDELAVETRDCRVIGETAKKRIAARAGGTKKE